MKQLVTLRTRPSRDGRRFVYMLDYVNEDGKRQRISLGHADNRKAKRQRDQKERELGMGLITPHSMRLRDFIEDSLMRTGDQIRESTRREYQSSMDHFISVIGNIDYQKVLQKHGERFLQACSDADNAPATAAKKLRELKRIFQLAVQRGQLDENPLRYLKQPKSSKKKIRTYTMSECSRMIKAASDFQTEFSLKWDLLITLALTTGMRRSEMLNMVWSDIDFANMTINVSPKKETDKTWDWRVKDTDCRTLPLTNEMVDLLAKSQSSHPEGYPYGFIPPERYDHIQDLRRQGKWTYSDARIKVVNNFTRHFKQILERPGVKAGQFHDLRRTALSNWFAQGLSEYDVMHLAGHAKFSTTSEFYLAVSDNLVSRARQATTKALGQDLARAPLWTLKQLRLPM